MPCYHPLAAWYSRERGASGKRGITFRLSEGFKDKPLALPCGRCIGCRLEKARQWALRCLHESKLWERNCFVTLTYDDKHVPEDGSLRPRDYVLFMKRLRKRYGEGVRFFHCGEYGESLGRPHHHAILFNVDFEDKWFYKSVGGNTLWTSKVLDGLWQQGFCSVGQVSFESAGYVARYALKKVTGPAAESHYGGRVPEYLTMSRRPGIGKAFFEKYRSDFYPSDECVVRGVVTKPPRYYDKLLEESAPSVLSGVKAARVRAALDDPDSTGSRLIVREEVKTAAVRTFSRRSI